MKYKATALLIVALQILHSVSTIHKRNGPSHHKIWKNDNEITNLKIESGVSNMRDHINLLIKPTPEDHGAHKNPLRNKDYDNRSYISSQQSYQPYHSSRSQYYYTQPTFDFSLRNNDDVYVRNQASASDPRITRTHPFGNSAHSTYNTQDNYLSGLYEDQVLRHNADSQNNEMQSVSPQPIKDQYIPSNGNITLTEPFRTNPDYKNYQTSRNLALLPNNRTEDVDIDSFEIDENYMILSPYEQPPQKVSKVSPAVLESSKNHDNKNISSSSDYEYYENMDLYNDIISQFSHEDFNHSNKSIIHSHQHFDSYDKHIKAKYDNATGMALGLHEIYDFKQQKTPYRPHLDPHNQPVSNQPSFLNNDLYNPPPQNPYQAPNTGMSLSDFPYQVPPRNIQNPHYLYQPPAPQLSQAPQRPAHPPFDPHDPFNLYKQPPNQNTIPHNTNALYQHSSRNPPYNPYDHDNIYRPSANYLPSRNAPYQPHNAAIHKITSPLSTVQNLSPNIHTDEDDCEYGTSWTMNCYHCVCNGSTATCIRDNNCKPLQSYVLNEPKLCKPFTRFPLDGSDCHRCQCTADGLPLCTFDYYACSRKTKQRFYKLQRETTLEIGMSSLNNTLSTTTMTCPAMLMYFNVWKCEPGSRWTARCFNCACDNYGQPICYRIIGCTPAPLSMPPKCRPGTTIPMKDCIDCYCDDDGFPAGQLPPPKSSGLSGAGAVIKEKQSSNSKEKSDSTVDPVEESVEIGLGKEVLDSLTSKATTSPATTIPAY